MYYGVLVTIILTVILVPCCFVFLFARFLPKLRYLPAALVLAFGIYLILSALGTGMTGGGISGFGDLPFFAGMFLGVVFILAAGVVFLASVFIYRRWGAGKLRKLDNKADDGMQRRQHLTDPPNQRQA